VHFPQHVRISTATLLVSFAAAAGALAQDVDAQRHPLQEAVGRMVQFLTTQSAFDGRQDLIASPTPFAQQRSVDAWCEWVRSPDVHAQVRALYSRSTAAVLRLDVEGNAASGDAARSTLQRKSGGDEAAGVQTCGIGPTRVRLPVASIRNEASLVLRNLHAAFAGLQALDAHSTRRALKRGAAEVNPVMKSVSGSVLGLATAKTLVGAGVISASEKLWKKNKVAAVVFMAAANSVMAYVVQHNYRVGR
jgi:hypothetical protein